MLFYFANCVYTFSDVGCYWLVDVAAATDERWHWWRVVRPSLVLRFMTTAIIMALMPVGLQDRQVLCIFVRHARPTSSPTTQNSIIPHVIKLNTASKMYVIVTSSASGPWQLVSVRVMSNYDPGVAYSITLLRPGCIRWRWYITLRRIGLSDNAELFIYFSSIFVLRR